MYHTSCTLHSVKGWLGSFVNIVLDIVTLYGLFHGTTYQSLGESFQITFSHLLPCLVCICVLHISSKLSMHSFGSLFIFSLFFCSFLEFIRVNFFLVCYSSTWLVFFFVFFNWDSLHARLNSHYKAWSYKKRTTKKITRYRKSV